MRHRNKLLLDTLAAGATTCLLLVSMPAAGQWSTETGTTNVYYNAGGVAVADPNIAKGNPVGQNYYWTGWRMNILAPSKQLILSDGGFTTGNPANPRQLTLQYDGANNRALIFALEQNVGFKPLILNPSGGFVGIGTLTPGVALDVNGDIRASGNIAAKYQDVAEWVPVRERLTVGTVVVLDDKRAHGVVPSSAPYDTMVAGVVSENPGVILGESGQGKAMVATTGRVKVRVDATHQAIRIGDLLVTGERPGAAMRSQPISVGGVQIHRAGTLIGKALEPLSEGEGEIQVLLSLQ